MEWTSGGGATAVRRHARGAVRAYARLPAWGVAALRPLRRHRGPRCSTTAPLPPKRSAIARGVAVPGARAWTIRARRACEEGCIPGTLLALGPTSHGNPL